MIETNLYRDHFQNFKRYNVPKAQLIITKLIAIENINFMLINNDDAIVRTEKFIESILTKKR